MSFTKLNKLFMLKAPSSGCSDDHLNINMRLMKIEAEAQSAV